MSPFPVLTLIGVSVCFVLTQYMIRYGVMDIPVKRSSHSVPTPKGGGIGIMTGLACGVFYILVTQHASVVTNGRILALALTMCALAAFSWQDDKLHFSASKKLAAQCLTTLIIVASALWGMAPTALSVLFFGLAVGFVMLVTNAVNFMDGINGLAAGTIALCAFVATPVFLINGQSPEAKLFFTLGMGCLAFLYFNYPKAKIFMGDVGSQPSGLILGWAGLVMMRDTTWPLLIPLMLSALLFDVLLTLIRRALRGENLMQAHCGHLYQIASRTMMPAPFVTATYWLFALWGAFACFVFKGEVSQCVAVLAPLIIWAILVLRHAGIKGGAP